MLIYVHLLEEQSDREREEGEVIHLLVHSPSAHSSKVSVRLKPGASISIQVSHMAGRGLGT